MYIYVFILAVDLYMYKSGLNHIRPENLLKCVLHHARFHYVDDYLLKHASSVYMYKCGLK